MGRRDWGTDQRSVRDRASWSCVVRHRTWEVDDGTASRRHRACDHGGEGGGSGGRGGFAHRARCHPCRLPPQLRQASAGSCRTEHTDGAADRAGAAAEPASARVALPDAEDASVPPSRGRTSGETRAGHSPDRDGGIRGRRPAAQAADAGYVVEASADQHLVARVLACPRRAPTEPEPEHAAEPEASRHAGRGPDADVRPSRVS